MGGRRPTPQAYGMRGGAPADQMLTESFRVIPNAQGAEVNYQELLVTPGSSPR